MRFFEVFGLAPQFRLNADALDAAFRAQQTLSHPDKFAHASASEQRLAQQRSALLNDAYSTLKDPVRRAAYLIENAGGEDPFAQTNTKMPAAFLIEHLQLRENLAAHRAAGAFSELETLHVSIDAAFSNSEDALAAFIDDEKNLETAAIEVRKLRFHQKLLAEIDSALA